MVHVTLVPVAVLVLLVLVLVVGALVWTLASSRRPGVVLAVLLGLAVLIGIPVLLVGAWFVAYERVGVSHRDVLLVQEQAAMTADAAPTEAGESAEAKPQVPEWVDREPQRRQDGSVLRTVTGRRYATPQESVDDALRQAADEARKYLEQAAPRPVRWEVPVSFVQDRLVQDQYVAQVDWEAEGVDSPPFAEPMYQAHLLIELTPEKRQTLSQMWQEDVLGQRIRWLAAGSAFVLVLLAALAGYLRLDEATRGYYSGRLKLAAVAVVGVAGVALLCAVA